MTTNEFDASASSPRHGGAVADLGSSPALTCFTAPSSMRFHATMADVTDEQHQNTPGMVRPEDFNPYVVVQFLRANGIDAWVGESDDGFGFVCDDPERASNLLFACVCLRASVSYACEAAYWCAEAKR
jgi:hypothetical protein